MMRNILLSSSSSVSAPNQKARMINEDAGTGVHQDLCPLSEASSALEHKISFVLIRGRLSHAESHVVTNFVLFFCVFSSKDQAGGNS